MKKQPMPVRVNYADGSSILFPSLVAYEIHEHPERAECGPMKPSLSRMLASVRKRAFGSTALGRAKGALEYISFHNEREWLFEGGEERALDSCFEMNDGDEVVRQLRLMAERTPAVRTAFERFDPSWVAHLFDNPMRSAA